MAIRVRIGFSGAPREVQLEVESGDALIEELERAQAEGAPMLWVTDPDGDRHGLIIDKITYVEIDKEQERSDIGFSSG
jgi:phosphomannomutase